MEPSTSAKSSRRLRRQRPASEEHDEEPRPTSDEEPVGMSLFERSHADVERGIQSSRVKELFPLGTFEGKSTDSIHLRSFVNRWKLYVTKHNIVDEMDKIVLGYKAFPPKSYALRWFEHLDITSFPTFDDFVRVFRLRFEMQEADRDKLLIREQRLRQREQDDVNDYVTVLHECWDALEGFGIIFTEEQKVTKFYINLQPDIKDFVVSQRVSNPNLGLNELIRHARQFENAHAKGKRSKEFVRFRQMNVPTTRNAVFCHFCRKAGHVWDDCPRIAYLKKQGKWKDRPRKVGPGQK